MEFQFSCHAGYHIRVPDTLKLLGAEFVPSSHLIVHGRGTFSYSEATLLPNAPYWRISAVAQEQLQQGFDAIGKLVRPEGLSAFASAVRSSLLLIGTGATFANVNERLTYTLSSLEAILLRHTAEPPEFSIANRMSLLIADKKCEREDIVRNVREAYRLRARQSISSTEPREVGSVQTFVRYAHQIVGIAHALANVESYGSIVEFLENVDHHQR